MTETDIIFMLAHWLDTSKFPYQLPNCFIYDWECDFWAMNAAGDTREFEIKTDYRDYLNDAKKEKHKDVSKGANYFYYVCPENLISANEVHHRYGLLYVTKYKTLKVIKKPKRLNDRKFQNWQMLANKMYWKWYQLWKDKKNNREITVDEWKAGVFNLEIQSFITE
jgi:hypothetical protein